MPFTGLGAALRTLRERKQWTQVELAKAAGLSDAAISKIENARRLPDCRSLGRILQALGVDVHELAVALDEVNGRARVPAPAFWPGRDAERVRLFRELASITERLSTLDSSGKSADESEARGRPGGAS